MKRQAEKAKRRRRPWARVIVDEIRRSEVDAATEVLRYYSTIVTIGSRMRSIDG